MVEASSKAQQRPGHRQGRGVPRLLLEKLKSITLRVSLALLFPQVP